MTTSSELRPAGRSVRCAVALAISVACGAALADQPPPNGGRAGADSGRPVGSRPTAGRLLCVHGIEAGQRLQVRAEAGADKPVIGSLPADQCGISLVGKCSGDWCEMALEGVRGWVDTRNVGIYEIPEVAKTKPAAAVAAATTAGPSRKAPVAASPSTIARKVAATAGDRSGRLSPSRQRRQVGDRGGVVDHFGPAHQARLYFGACVSRVAWWDTLRIRSGPGTGHGAIGGIPPGACRIEPAGACRGAWCRVAWRGRVGWVNAFYLE